MKFSEDIKMLDEIQYNMYYKYLIFIIDDWYLCNLSRIYNQTIKTIIKVYEKSNFSTGDWSNNVSPMPHVAAVSILQLPVPTCRLKKKTKCIWQI